LPLSPTGNYSLLPSALPRFNASGEYDSPSHHDFKLGEKVTCLKPSGGEAKPVPRPALDYLTARTPKVRHIRLITLKESTSEIIATVCHT
jgi:hypothetical protein